MEEQLRALFPLIPELRDQPVTINVLGGGLTNRNYKLDTPEASYVLRIAGQGTGLLGINRASEAACARAAADAGVAPAVIACLPDHNALLRAFVEGKSLTTEDVRLPETLPRIAAAVRRFHDHQIPPNAGRFSPFAVVRSYYSLAVEKQVTLPIDLNRALERLAQLETELQTGEPPRLCHNDLLPANFIDTGSAVRIIDWEYAGMGDYFFDLGNLAVNSQLDAEQERALLIAYGGTASPEHLRRLRLMRLVSDMREAMWGFVQAGISTIQSPAEYLQYGRKHLDRFLAGGRPTAVMEKT